MAPGAGELAQKLAAHAQTPGAAVAGLGGLIAAGVVFLFGLLIAAISPEESFIDLGGDGLTKEAFNQAAAFTLSSLETGRDTSFRSTPALFVMIPLGAIAAATASLTTRTRELGSGRRVAWGAGAAVPFAFVMLVFALVAGKTDREFDFTFEQNIGAVFALSLLWGAVGGFAGAFFAIRREEGSLSDVIPPRVRPTATVLRTALRPFVLFLVVTGLIGAGAVAVQTVRDAGDVQRDRSTVIATTEAVLYVGEHSVHFAELGSGSSFTNPASTFSLPFPVADIDEVRGEADREDDANFDASLANQGLIPGEFRIFDYRDALPTWAFILMLALIPIPILFALYAGFSLGRLAPFGTTTGRLMAAGALVGPIWAIAMVLVNALVTKPPFGHAVGDTVFVSFLLGGVVFGALGGLLAGQGDSASAAAAPPPTAASS